MSLRIVLVSFLISLSVSLVSASPGTWTDSKTGFAIGGYDPLSYFIENKPLRGKMDHQLTWDGVGWRFMNEGNRVEFKRYPDVYAPRFSGYDPYALSIENIVEGKPVIWAIHKKRLYFFQNIINRKLWLEDPQTILQKARKIWPTTKGIYY